MTDWAEHKLLVLKQLEDQHDTTNRILEKTECINGRLDRVEVQLEEIMKLTSNCLSDRKQLFHELSEVKMDNRSTKVKIATISGVIALLISLAGIVGRFV